MRGRAKAKHCFAFRAPPAYARDLRLAGFTVMNNANNHSYDFGPAGQADTVRALHAPGIAQTGLPGEITIVHAGGLRVAHARVRALLRHRLAARPAGRPAR